MSDLERLQAMSSVANTILAAAPLTESDHVYQKCDDESFTISLHRNGRNFAQWQIDVTAPFLSRTRGEVVPARLWMGGVSITPLSLGIVNAINGLMWENRER